jgi:hypothetical protein
MDVCNSRETCIYTSSINDNVGNQSNMMLCSNLLIFLAQVCNIGSLQGRLKSGMAVELLDSKLSTIDLNPAALP